MDLTSLITFYAQQLEDLRKKLDQKRFSLGEADSAKESRFPTGRVELESEIKMLEDKLVSCEKLLYQLRNVATGKTKATAIQNGVFATLRLDNEQADYFFVETGGDLTNNILSLNSPLGQEALGLKIGDKKTTATGMLLEVVAIK